MDGSRGRARAFVLALAAAVLAGAALCAVAAATSLPVRTFDVSALASPQASSEAADPAVSADGTTIAYDTTAGGTEQVYALAVLTGVRTLVSHTATGSPAPAPASTPSVSADGATIAFQSSAVLASGASGSFTNVYVREPDGHVVLASGGLHGAVADGAASQPALAGDGRYVASTSTAGNLTGGGSAHGPEVYVHDLRTGRTVLVSAARSGARANGWAGNPAIDGAGAVVTFDSDAHNLVRRRVRGAQIYAATWSRHRMALVSATSGGIPQNGSQPAPFRQVSSISANGRWVAFDSTGSNLVRGDLNRRSDVFLHDLRRGRTTLISEGNAGYEGNNDSFSPTISTDGTKVAFESFASNLAPGGGPRENVFVRDLSLGLTSVVDVGPTGQRPGPERVKELLQRPVVSSNGYVAAFESTAQNLTGEAAPQTHVFLRLMDPAQASFSAPSRARGGRRASVAAVADDPAARAFACQLNSGSPFACRPGRIVVSRLRRGANRITIRAGGPGLLYQAVPLVARVVSR